MAYGYLVPAISTLSISAALLNLFLIYVVYRYSFQMGAYKWLLIFFAFFEFCYASLVFVTLPFSKVFHVHDYRAVLFSHSQMIAESVFAKLFAGLYCSFYQMWLGLVAIMFFYRYIVCCRVNWYDRIKESNWIKLVFLALYLTHVANSVMCGVRLCSITLPQRMIDEIKDEYNLHRVQHLGYIVTTLKNADDTFSWSGFLNVGNHSLVLTISVPIIIFCGCRVWKKICEMGEQTTEYKQNKQIFYTLVLQSTIPLTMYQIPLVFILYALFYYETLFGNISPFLSLMTTVPKILDPLFCLIVIRDYRNVVKQMFTRRTINVKDVTVTEIQLTSI